MISASFERYVHLVCEQLGVHEVFATRWRVDPTGQHLTGGLQGANVRGEEKARIVREQLHIESLDFAYGDSAGDAALLALLQRHLYASSDDTCPPNP